MTTPARTKKDSSLAEESKVNNSVSNRVQVFEKNRYFFVFKIEISTAYEHSDHQPLVVKESQQRPEPRILCCTVVEESSYWGTPHQKTNFDSAVRECLGKQFWSTLNQRGGAERLPVYLVISSLKGKAPDTQKLFETIFRAWNGSSRNEEQSSADSVAYLRYEDELDLDIYVRTGRLSYNRNLVHSLRMERDQRVKENTNQASKEFENEYFPSSEVLLSDATFLAEYAERNPDDADFLDRVGEALWKGFVLEPDEKLRREVYAKLEKLVLAVEERATVCEFIGAKWYGEFCETRIAESRTAVIKAFNRYLATVVGQTGDEMLECAKRLEKYCEVNNVVLKAIEGGVEVKAREFALKVRAKEKAVLSVGVDQKTEEAHRINGLGPMIATPLENLSAEMQEKVITKQRAKLLAQRIKGIGGKKGGKARAEKLSPKRRREIGTIASRAAAKARGNSNP